MGTILIFLAIVIPIVMVGAVIFALRRYRVPFDAYRREIYSRAASPLGQLHESALFDPGAPRRRAVYRQYHARSLIDAERIDRETNDLLNRQEQSVKNVTPHSAATLITTDGKTIKL